MKTGLGLGLCVGAVAWAAAMAGPAAAQEREIDYWIGDMRFTGTAQQDAGLNFSGNTLNFNSGRSDPVNGQVRIKLWVPEDGVPRLQIDKCVSALFPAKTGVTFATGGLFTPDLAYAGSPPRCGLAAGEEVLKQTNTLTPRTDGILYAYTGENRIQSPYTGKANIKGEVLLRPVYKPLPPPPAPPPPPVQVAAPAPAPAPATTAAPAAPRAQPSAGVQRLASAVDRSKIQGIPEAGKKTWQIALNLDAIDNLGVVYVSNDKGSSPVLACSWQPMLPGRGSLVLDPYIVKGVHAVYVFVYDQETGGLSSLLTAGKWSYNISLTDKDGALWQDSGTGPTTTAGVVFAKRFLIERTEEGQLIVFPDDTLPATTVRKRKPDDVLIYFKKDADDFVAFAEDMVASAGNTSSDFLGAGRVSNYQNINC